MTCCLGVAGLSDPVAEEKERLARDLAVVIHRWMA